MAEVDSWFPHLRDAGPEGRDQHQRFQVLLGRRPRPDQPERPAEDLLLSAPCRRPWSTSCRTIQTSTLHDKVSLPPLPTTRSPFEGALWYLRGPPGSSAALHPDDGAGCTFEQLPAARVEPPTRTRAASCSSCTPWAREPATPRTWSRTPRRSCPAGRCGGRRLAPVLRRLGPHHRPGPDPGVQPRQRLLRRAGGHDGVPPLPRPPPCNGAQRRAAARGAVRQRHAVHCPGRPSRAGVHRLGHRHRGDAGRSSPTRIPGVRRRQDEHPGRYFVATCRVLGVRADKPLDGPLHLVRHRG